MQHLFPRTPRWERALVTGASSGIGREIARQLAASGVDLVLVARSGERLDELAAHLRAGGSGPNVEVFEADLCDSEFLAAVEARLASAGAPVDLLVNNAGLGYEGPFHRQDAQEVSETIDLNVTALVRLTHAALKPMVARGRGQVILVSSMASLQGLPMTAVYAATKALITSLGEALYEELKGTGVVVTTVLPGLTRTEFHERGRWDLDRWPSVGWQSAEEVAAEALGAAARLRPEVVTGRLNRVLAAMSGMAHAVCAGRPSAGPPAADGPTRAARNRARELYPNLTAENADFKSSAPMPWFYPNLTAENADFKSSAPMPWFYPNLTAEKLFSFSSW